MEGRIVARERKSPLLAKIAPALYLLACAGALWGVFRDPSGDYGVQGLLLAVGLVPAFVVPAVFSSRSVVVAVSGEKLLVGGRAIVPDDVKVQPGNRGAARVQIDTEDGPCSLHFASAKEAEHLLSQLDG